MGTANLLTACILALLGLAMIVFVCRILVRAAVGDLRGWQERKRLQKKRRIAQTVETGIAELPLSSTLQMIQEAFYLEPVLHDARLVEPVQNHNLSLLSRLIIISEKYSKHLSNLAVVEELLLTRSELTKESLDVLRLITSLRKKRQEKESSGPEWAVVEYGKKLKELEDRLVTNRKSLDSQLHSIFTALREMQDVHGVTYH